MVSVDGIGLGNYTVLFVLVDLVIGGCVKSDFYFIFILYVCIQPLTMGDNKCLMSNFNLV